MKARNRKTPKQGATGILEWPNGDVVAVGPVQTIDGSTANVARFDEDLNIVWKTNIASASLLGVATRYLPR